MPHHPELEGLTPHPKVGDAAWIATRKAAGCGAERRAQPLVLGYHFCLEDRGHDGPHWCACGHRWGGE